MTGQWKPAPHEQTRSLAALAGSTVLMIALLLVADAAAIPATAEVAVETRTVLAPTPPMGWANWNRFFCDYDEQTIRAQADALVATGMRDLGYKYLIIQECIAPDRDTMGNLVVDAKRFPHGMKTLADYIPLPWFESWHLHRCWAVYVLFETEVPRELQPRRSRR